MPEQSRGDAAQEYSTCRAIAARAADQNIRVLRSQIGQGVDDRPAQQPRAPYQPLGEVATRFLQRPFEGFSLFVSVNTWLAHRWCDSSVWHDCDQLQLGFQL